MILGWRVGATTVGQGDEVAKGKRRGELFDHIEALVRGLAPSLRSPEYRGKGAAASTSYRGGIAFTSRRVAALTLTPPRIRLWLCGRSSVGRAQPSQG